MNEKQKGPILVPLKGNPTDEEVMRLACGLAKKYRTLLYAIRVVVVPQELALECDMTDHVTHAEDVLEKAGQIAQEYGVELETGILQARSAGVAIVEEAQARQVSLIMLSVTYRSRRGEFNMGQTVPYVLKNASCRVWMFRDELKKNQ